MKKLILTLTFALVTATSFAAPSVLRKSGDCKLQVAEAFDEKVVKVELANADVQITAEFRGGDFFGEFTLFSGPTIVNKSGKKLTVSYNVAFFDKAGELVACAAQNGDLDKDTRGMQFGSCLSKLPEADFAKISSYKVVVYVNAAKEKK